MRIKQNEFFSTIVTYPEEIDSTLNIIKPPKKKIKKAKKRRGEKD